MQYNNVQSRLQLKPVKQWGLERCMHIFIDFLKEMNKWIFPYYTPF